MAISKTTTLMPATIIKKYTCDYTTPGSKATKTLNATSFIDSDGNQMALIPGYTVGAVVDWFSGSGNKDVTRVYAGLEFLASETGDLSNAPIMSVKDATQTSGASATAVITLLWVRNDLIKLMF